MDNPWTRCALQVDQYESCSGSKPACRNCVAAEIPNELGVPTALAGRRLTQPGWVVSRRDRLLGPGPHICPLGAATWWRDEVPGPAVKQP